MADYEKTARLKRLRDAAATREAILDAACTAFMDHGYEQVGVRDIAAVAGVTAALINRYFGSKEALFREVLDRPRPEAPSGDVSVARLFADRSRIGISLAHAAVTNQRGGSRFDPMLVFLRSLGQPAAEAVLRERMTIWLAPFAAGIGGQHAEIRAELIIATLTGVDLMRNVFKSPALAAADEKYLIEILGRTLQRYVDGEIA